MEIGGRGVGSTPFNQVPVPNWERGDRQGWPGPQPWGSTVPLLGEPTGQEARDTAGTKRECVGPSRALPSGS